MALSLWADAVAMGTRFATTEESPIADQIKGAVLNLKPDGGATEADTLYGKNFDESSSFPQIGRADFINP